jgi:hypothetical protein
VGQIYEAFVEVLTTLKLVNIEASTPDEAEQIAEEMAKSRVQGTIVEREVMSVGVEPMLEQSDEEETV